MAERVLVHDTMVRKLEGEHHTHEFKLSVPYSCSPTIVFVHYGSERVQCNPSSPRSVRRAARKAKRKHDRWMRRAVTMNESLAQANAALDTMSVGDES